MGPSDPIQAIVTSAPSINVIESLPLSPKPKYCMMLQEGEERERDFGVRGGKSWGWGGGESSDLAKTVEWPHFAHD